MNDQSGTLRLREGYLLRSVGKNRVLIPLYNNVANFNGIITLNASAELLIRLLQEGTDRKAMSGALQSAYGISEERAAADTETLLRTLSEHDMLEGR